MDVSTDAQKWLMPVLRLAQFVCQLAVPGTYMFLVYTTWSDTEEMYMRRVYFCNSVVLLAGLENCLIPIRFLRRSSILEYQISVLYLVVFAINAHEQTNDGSYFDAYVSHQLNSFEFFSVALFILVLAINTIAILFLFLGMLVLSFYLLLQREEEQPHNEVGGASQLTGINEARQLPIRGLFPEELALIQVKQYSSSSSSASQLSSVRHNRKEEVEEYEEYEERKSHQEDHYLQLSSSSNLTEKCSICLLSFYSGEDVCTLPVCAHSFHLLCIHAWLSTNPRCPFCRHNILAELLKAKEIVNQDSV